MESDLYGNYHVMDHLTITYIMVTTTTTSVDMDTAALLPTVEVLSITTVPPIGTTETHTSVDTEGVTTTITTTKTTTLTNPVDTINHNTTNNNCNPTIASMVLPNDIVKTSNDQYQPHSTPDEGKHYQLLEHDLDIV
jgi:hypothetical protein